MKIQVDRRQLVCAVSDALDLVGVDDFFHGKRTAFMAVSIGRAQGLDEDALDRVFHGALIHDSGVSSTRVHRQLVNELDWDGSQEHCLRGQQLLAEFSPFSDLADLVRYHHTHWKSLSATDLPRSTAELSNLIYLADRVDALAAPFARTGVLMGRQQIINTVTGLSGTFFSPRWVEGFRKVAAAEAFWFSMEPRHLHQFLGDMSRRSYPCELDFGALKDLATLFSRIVDAKSPFTVEHSLGVSKLARLLGEIAGVSQENCDKIELAGLMHDIGKLAVADHILEKPEALNESETMQMKRHSFETYQILRRIPGLEEVALWAAFHHETLNGTGYPYHHEQESLALEARIITAADVFQALAQDRPYRRAMPPAEILGEMKTMMADGRLDGAVVKLIAGNLNACWRAALHTVDQAAPRLRTRCTTPEAASDAKPVGSALGCGIG